jgi:DNA-binding IclR family transcriptional regulator
MIPVAAWSRPVVPPPESAVPVKRSHSGTRILSVLEAIAGHQPIGVRALARVMNEDKSAIQRAVATLADEGWIRNAREPVLGWEVTARILAVATTAQGSNDLRRRARPLVERLRDESGETVLLVVPDLQNFVIADVAESRQVLRLVPQIGTVVNALNTATGRALLPYMEPARQLVLLGSAPGGALNESFRTTRKQGYAVSDGEINPVATSIAAPIFELDGFPCGALVVSAPRDRLTPARHKVIGKLIVAAAAELSRSAPRAASRKT